MSPTTASAAVLDRVRAHRTELARVLDKYQATEPLIFGSVARGDATTNSDLDVMVTLTAARANPWMRLAGLTDEFSSILGMRVDVVSAPHLRSGVGRYALRHTVPL